MRDPGAPALLAAGIGLLLLVGCGHGSQGAAAPPESTGAVSTSTAEDRGAGDARPIQDVIRGFSSGLQVIDGADGEFRFRIRGMDSIDNQQEPLIIIDGSPMPLVPASQALRGIRSEEIAEVEVLRDVASTSVYGMRGAAGVILITTRDRDDA